MIRLLVTFLSIILVVHANCQTWNWVKGIDSENQVASSDLNVEQNGDVQIVGITNASYLNIGNLQMTNTADSGWYSYFLVKYDSNGIPLWIDYPIHSEFSSSSLTSVDSDSENNIYAVGSFIKSIEIGGVSYFAGTGNGKGDMLIVKYDSNGNVLWVRDTDNPNQVYSVAASFVKAGSNGSIYVAGYFNDNYVDFGDTIIYNSQGAYVNKIFVSKWSSAGSFEGVITLESDYGVDVHGLELDGQNNVYLIADYRGNYLSIGDSTFINATQDTSLLDVVWARFDENLEFAWAGAISSANDEFVRGLAVKSNGDFFISGGFGGTSLTCKGETVFGGGQCTTTFLVSLDSANEVNWAKSVGNQVNSWGVDLNVINDHIQMTGMFANQMDFMGNSVSSNGATDSYFASFSDSGSLDFVLHAGGINHDTPKRIETDGQNNIYALGHTASIDFSAGNLNLGVDDGIYLLKMNSGFPVLNEDTTGTIDTIGMGDSTGSGVGFRFIDFNSSTILRVFPNPFHSSFIVETTVDSKMEVIDVHGAILHSEIIRSMAHPVYLDPLPNGIYLLRVTNDNGVQSVRIVKA